MDERFDARIPPPMERLGGPKMGGGAFRRLPIVPVVALVMFFLGLSAGFGLASKTQPASPAGPSASVAASASASASASAASSGPTFAPTVAPTPPAGGITLGQAIAAAKGELDFDDSEIVSATLIDDRSAPDQPPGRWLWEIAIDAPGTAPCFDQSITVAIIDAPGPSSSITAASPSPELCRDQSGTIDVDYLTGQVAGASWGASVP